MEPIIAVCFKIAIVGSLINTTVDTTPVPEMAKIKLPAEKASVEAILKTLESTVTSDGLLHIANCVEANLSGALANPHQSDELSQHIIDLHESMDEVRNRYAQTREKEITLESARLRERLSSWSITTKPNLLR
ncbi:hypothetical protein NPIL_695251 [Nephila pilipes]|uniref:Uncharacterized protein n=1 Tax=Nephila pilipes TaxID=299642 RepID=A0A8X6NNN9_NEPPI|nr:hypothetical protein NPIL_695251 [Nephila pilipes]